MPVIGTHSLSIFINVVNVKDSGRYYVENSPVGRKQQVPTDSIRRQTDLFRSAPGRHDRTETRVAPSLIDASEQQRHKSRREGVTHHPSCFLNRPSKSREIGSLVLLNW